jgi:Fe-Mn family superoxide dismutase
MFGLPNLPYPYDALAPVISAETLRFHHDKHHAGYVKAANDILAKTDAHWPRLEAVVSHAAAVSDMKLFNSAAQAWNHAFYWVAMSPDHEQPTGDLESAITTAFGSLAKLKEAFVDAGVGQFGSGWVWMAADMHGKLRILTTHDAGTILTQPQLTPLLVADVWEHAYYIDYRNERKAHLEAWFDTLPNWGFAASQLAASRSDASQWGYPPPS